MVGLMTTFSRKRYGLPVAAFIAFACCGCKAAGAHEIRRPAEPASLSGVTWVSNSTYLAATDWNPTLWELTIPMDMTNARPFCCQVRRLVELEGSKDVEDVEVDPLDASRILVADEYTATINIHDLKSGKLLGSVGMPGPLGKPRTDMGLESLTVSRDGKELWTASEEAVAADGPISDRQHGTDVRLTRFVRESAASEWHLDGQWIYRTDPIAGGSWKKNKSSVDSARSGVSGLCLLGDGTLLALEREFSVVILPRFRCRIYEVDYKSATDVSSFDSITNAIFTRTSKSLVHETTGFSMYEGICEGPRLADGARSVVLVSDGDDLAVKSVMTLRLEK